MFGRSKSAQKFRTVEAPRTREGRAAEEYSPGGKAFLSARKPQAYNPQSPPPNKSKCHHNTNKYDAKIAQKLDIGDYTTMLGASAQNFKDFESPGKNYKPSRQQEKQQTIHGRNLQYPHAKNANYRPQTAPENQRLRKYNSSETFSSKHFTDRAARSRSRIAQEKLMNQKVKKAFNYLISNNAAYLREHSRICNQRARPKDQIFKINLAKTPSTYCQHYPPKKVEHKLDMDPQNEKTALGLGPRKVCGNSTNNEVHNGRQGPRADLATWPQGFKLQGPIDSTTTYANHFPHHGDFDAMVPVVQFKEIVRGMPFKKNTTHRDHFKGQFVDRADIATWNNLHPYGNDFNPDRGTHYQTTHNFKQKKPIQQWPMYDPRLIVTDGKFTTENRDRLINEHAHELNDANYCGCDRKRCIH